LLRIPYCENQHSIISHSSSMINLPFGQTAYWMHLRKCFMVLIMSTTTPKMTHHVCHLTAFR